MRIVYAGDAAAEASLVTPENFNTHFVLDGSKPPVPMVAVTVKVAPELDLANEGCAFPQTLVASSMDPEAENCGSTIATVSVAAKAASALNSTVITPL